MNETNQAGMAANPRPKANCDQEAWVKDRIRTAIDMALALRKVGGTGADERSLQGGIDGIVNGVAVEIIYLLGMEPEFVHLTDSLAVPRLRRQRIDGPVEILEKAIKENTPG